MSDERNNGGGLGWIAWAALLGLFAASGFLVRGLWRWVSGRRPPVDGIPSPVNSRLARACVVVAGLPVWLLARGFVSMIVPSLSLFAFAGAVVGWVVVVRRFGLWDWAADWDRLSSVSGSFPAHAYAVGLKGGDGYLPAVGKVEAVPGGYLIPLGLPGGVTVEDVRSRLDALAGAYGAWSALVEPDPVRADLCTLRLLLSDPLAADLGPWPLLAADTWDLSQPVPVAVGVDGEIVTVDMWQSSLLVAGSPGAGKSVAMWLPILAAAKDPTVELWVIDAKGGVEMSALEPRCARFATNLDEGLPMLEELLSIVKDRAYRMREKGLRKAEKGDSDFHPIVLVVDELAEVTGVSGNRESKAAAETLRRIVALGRAENVSVIMATQKPASDVVPTGLRDIMRYRWGMRCGMPGQAMTIAPEVVNELTSIPPTTPGVGYLVTETGELAKCRAWFVSDSDIDQAVSAAVNRPVGENFVRDAFDGIVSASYGPDDLPGG